MAEQDRTRRKDKFQELSTYNIALLRLDARKGIVLAYFISAMILIVTLTELFIPNYPSYEKAIPIFIALVLFIWVMFSMFKPINAVDKIYRDKMGRLANELRLFPKDANNKVTTKQSKQTQNTLLLKELSTAVIGGIIATALYAYVISPVITPRPFILITQTEFITNYTTAYALSAGNMTKFKQFIGTRLVSIDFENTGKANCDHLNFTVQTINGTSLYWWTNILPNITVSLPPPLVKVTNQYGGSTTFYGETKFNVFIQYLEPYESGYVYFRASNSTFIKGAVVAQNQTYINITDVSLCEGAQYAIVNRTYE